MDWLAALQDLRRDGQPAVLVTVADVRGHAPRNPGAKLVVGMHRTWGSVGGGNLEETAIQRARELITTGARRAELSQSKLSEHARNEHGRQCCGGEVTLLLEPFPARPTVAIFGVGHVGYELARILSRHELRLVLVDSRAEQLDELRLADVTSGAADVQVHRQLLGEQVLQRLPADADVLIMTHDHAEDFALCDAAVRLLADRPGTADGPGSIGLIGSRAKWSRFRRNLLAEGHRAELVDGIRCPIGRPDLTGKEPAQIALGVAAELIAEISRRTAAAAGAGKLSAVSR